MKEKKFLQPQVEIIKLTNEDIITSSTQDGDMGVIPFDSIPHDE